MANVEVESMQPTLTALYIGDLEGSVTEEELRRLFDGAGGDVVSVKICKDEISQQSLGYGYVNYGNPQDAEKALELLNFSHLKGRCIRISFSDRKNSPRKSGQGNIFVKNLDKTIDHKALHDMFCSYGKVLSCKVESDSSGESKGYGYLQYEDEETASKAIEDMHGLSLHGKELYAVPYISKQDRELSLDKTKFTNVFVKNISECTTEDDLRSIFGEFGGTTSVAVMRDQGGHSKCFGFVNFENAEDAARSVEVVNGRICDGKEWYVGRAQKKSEREVEIKLQRDQTAKEMLEMDNLYIKNIDDSINDVKLKELFSPFGTIKSCKVMTDTRGLSKGYGFLAFSTPQEASTAISQMNGRIVGNKPLFVSIAERKEIRQQRLQSLFTANMHETTVVPSPMPTYFPMYLGYGHPIFYNDVAAPMPPNMPGFGYQQQFRVGPSLMFPTIQNSRPPFPVMHHQHQQIPSRGTAHPGFRTFHAYSQGSTSLPHSMHNTRPVPVETLTSALANASPSEQRTMLGNNLFPLVQQVVPEMAVKVTSMLLEMDLTEVLHLLESPESLRAEVVQAMDALKNAPPHHPL